MIDAESTSKFASRQACCHDWTSKICSIHACGHDWISSTHWRTTSLNNRIMWKVLSTLLLITYCTWYLYTVMDSPVLTFMGGVFLLKLLIEIWAQHGPTWIAPSTWPLLIFAHTLLMWETRMFGTCRVGDVALPYRETFALALYCFGSSYSLSYELHRFWWKAQPENEGRLHTTGLARYCVHPNYFGDFFTFLGWGMAAGTLCAMSFAPMSLHWVIFMLIPNSEAYLAQKYPDEFSFYLARTAPLIPGVRSGSVMKAIGLIGTVVGMVGMLYCGEACGMSSEASGVGESMAAHMLMMG